MSRLSSILAAATLCGVAYAGQAMGAAVDNYESYSPGNIHLADNGDVNYYLDPASNGTAVVVNDSSFAYEGNQFLRINDPEDEPTNGRTYLDAYLAPEVSIDGGRIQFAYRRGETQLNGLSYLVYGRNSANYQSFSHAIYLPYNGTLQLYTNGSFSSLIDPPNAPTIMATDRWYLFTMDHTQDITGHVTWSLDIKDTSDNSTVAHYDGLSGFTKTNRTLFGTQAIQTNGYLDSIHNFDAFYVGAVPEPASTALLALCGFALCGRRRES
ncbi:MAG: PEP-CTERM sorting domain-containing protein [Phycisphaerales bacterium]|nr:PEP-CTERM sorting domain-containing protein [Phycisphaerales bacterium]